MKYKIIMIIAIVLTLSGCTINKNMANNKAQAKKEEIKEPTYGTEGIYVNNGFITSTTEIENSINLNDTIQSINIERGRIIDESNPKVINEYLYTIEGKKEFFTDEEINLMLNLDGNAKVDMFKKVTYGEALEDISSTFKLLKEVYGAYGYFGGEEVFSKAEEKSKEALEDIEGEISIKKLEGILMENLSFINDGHFSINGNSLSTKYDKYYYYNEDFDFLEDDKGYYTLLKEEKWYLESIDENKNIDEYMKLSVNDNGILVYNIGVLKSGNEPLINGIMTLTNMYEVKECEFYYMLSGVANKEYESSFEEEEINGIPVISVNIMMKSRENDNSLYAFMYSGERLKDEEVFIIDLRGNRGGSDQWCDAWFKNYTNSYAQRPTASSQRVSKVSVYGLKSYLENTNTEYSDNLLDYYNDLIESENYDFWSEPYHSKGEWVNNDALIFVLIDKRVASSGETFVKNLRTLENVIFVGSNTSGCSLVPNNLEYYLPNSNMKLYFGTGLTLWEEFENIDGVGIKPDIWVNTIDAKERVLKLIENYDLKENQ